MKFSSIILRVFRAASCAALLLACSGAYGAASASDQQFLVRAQKPYSNLREKGLVTFEASLTPDWTLALKGQTPEATAQGLKLLQKIWFKMVQSEDNSVRITHGGEVGAVSEKQQAGLNQIYAGMEQMVTGFFSTWSTFMLTPPLPDPASDYELAHLDEGYRLTYKEDKSRVTTTLGKDAIVTEVSVVDPGFTSTLHPHFVASPQGLLLDGYQALYIGSGGANTTTLDIQISYELAGGLLLPSKLHLAGTYNKEPFNVEVAFSDYQVRKK